MFAILPESTEKAIGFKVSGKVTADDYEALMPKLDEAISAHGRINLLVVIGDIEGMEGMDEIKQYRFMQMYIEVLDVHRIGYGRAVLTDNEEMADFVIGGFVGVISRNQGAREIFDRTKHERNNPGGGGEEFMARVAAALDTP